ncbi:MAG: hypothetical protein WBJ54_09750 [Syntrophorhabdus sp.]|jgi:hypothetical protein|nr:hypothetical protein [Syntrophorhabdus sp.]MDI9557416.1 hypothetical protein [Pseudomonadota bacterium]OPX97582.1 MAG: hypothetical protein A4E59_00685 [Syntrophorhabdus sp. PtaB.Bin027]OQB73967.1 MAG: hypothetical protein BWX92_03187 [Deltaproteobacteria bacterium ADurb.Bin135]MBP8745796.1 hypothetical protein [Syntrophorhabdus sp.]
MSKLYMTCPFSKGKCIQCAIYRGRHAEICFAAGYHGGEFKDLMKPKAKPTNPTTELKFPFPSISESPNRISNVEDCVLTGDGVKTK